MKISDAEWQWDRKKLTFYFTADKRVDFRNLVRDLASLFRTRIELKQIGVRDEAKRLDGIGRCGRQYCSASWLPELRPVNLGVAKDQRLSLNPSQISGACGRLMCCLRYEHEFYVQSRKRFPKEGKIVTTTLGEEKVVGIDIFHERVTLRGVEGDMRTVPLGRVQAGDRGVSGGWRARQRSTSATKTNPRPREFDRTRSLRSSLYTAEQPGIRASAGRRSRRAVELKLRNASAARRDERGKAAARKTWRSSRARRATTSVRKQLNSWQSTTSPPPSTTPTAIRTRVTPSRKSAPTL